MDNYDYYASYTSIASAAGVSFKCCATNLNSFKISKAADDVIVCSGGAGSLEVPKSQLSPDKTVTVNFQVMNFVFHE